MQYSVNFGSLTRPQQKPATGAKFRLAVLGDFSGRANAGKLETGEALARRKPIKVDVDNLDAVMARMNLKLSLPLGGPASAIEVKVASIDDLHPDQLYESVALFQELATLRKNLGSKAGFDRAAKEVLSWSGEERLPPPGREKARGGAIPTDRKLSDFARLTGRAAVVDAAESSADELIRRIMGAYIQPATDKRQDQLVARVDEALTGVMNAVLHHPDFQTLEATWRSVELLVRRIETGAKMEIVLYDVSAEELAADVAGTDKLEDTGLYGMLAEQPALDAHQGALSAVIGLYDFELSPPHAELLGRIARIAAAANTPFLASIGPDALQGPIHNQHPLIKESWSALMATPEAAYLGLTTPRFLLRMPYGKKSEPIDVFAFEEFSRQSGLSGMLWGSSAVLAGFLLATTYSQQGAKMKLGTVMGVGDMAYYIYYDADGEPIALPCTERMYSERQAVQVSNYRVMPVVSIRGRPEVRLASFNSLAGTPLAGFWAPVTERSPDAGAVSAPAPAEAPPVAVLAPMAAQAIEAEPDADAAMAAFLADLGGPAPAPAPEPEAEQEPEPEPAPQAEAPADDDLDALLASLNPPPAETAPDETELDLDALLASLN